MVEPPRDIIPFASRLAQTPVNGFGASQPGCNTLGLMVLGAVLTYFAPPVIGGFLAGVRDAFEENSRR